MICLTVSEISIQTSLIIVLETMYYTVGGIKKREIYLPFPNRIIDYNKTWDGCSKGITEFKFRSSILSRVGSTEKVFNTYEISHTALRYQYFVNTRSIAIIICAITKRTNDEDCQNNKSWQSNIICVIPERTKVMAILN